MSWTGESLSDGTLVMIENTISGLRTENFKLTEALANVEMMIDAKGWTSLFESGHDGGLKLEDLKSAAAQVRELIVGNPFMKQAALVRSMLVWGGGLEFATRNAKGETKDLTAKVRERIDKVGNQRYIFSTDGQVELEMAAAADGNLFVIVDPDTFAIQRIPLVQITADRRNPDNPEEIWMFRRAWVPDPAEPNKQKVEWYYTDIYEGERKKKIKYKNEPETISPKIMIDKTFNRQVGWAYGVGDGLAAMAWSKLYKEFLINGFIMSRSLAMLAFKVTSKPQVGGASAAAEIARPGQQAGSTATMGSGNSLEAVSTAGKGYDFDSGRALAAGIAAGFGVSITSIIGEGGAGGNAAAESTLDAVGKASASMRRQSWQEFYTRILRALGNTQKIEFTWHDLNEEAINRQMQAWVLAHGTGLFEGEVIQGGMARAMQIARPGAVPKGYKLLNNSEVDKAAAETAMIGKPTDSPNGGTTGAGGATGGTGQGKNSPAGKGANDHSTDDNGE